MSGRRLREKIRTTIIEKGGAKDTKVIITGLSNVYTNYIATPEEYQVSRFSFIKPKSCNIIYGFDKIENNLIIEINLKSLPMINYIT